MRKIKNLFIVVLIIVIVAFPIPIFSISEEIAPYEYYYEQLSIDEKMLYREMSKLYDDSTLGITSIAEFEDFDFVFIYDKDTVPETEDYNEAVSEIEEIQAAQQGISHAMRSAHIALQMDHPELFGYSYRGYFWYDIDFDEEDTLTVFLNFVIEIFPIEGYGEYEEEFLRIFDKIRAIGAAGTRIEKLKAIHNYLVLNAKYKENESRAFTAAGAYLDGETVCQGYALAFKMACDYYGVPCVCVAGYSVQNQKKEKHMWNYVQMPDQKWYAVDVTWDDLDQSDFLCYDYFLVGTSTRDEYLGGYQFWETHKEDSGAFELTRQFSYPSLAESAYIPSKNEPIDTGLPPWITPSLPPTAAPTLPPIPTFTVSPVEKTPMSENEPVSSFEETDDNNIKIIKNNIKIILLLSGTAMFAGIGTLLIIIKKRRNQ